ncbi:MAG: putative metal-binding motif-containing protein [Sandaracinus sp.]
MHRRVGLAFLVASVVASCSSSTQPPADDGGGTLPDAASSCASDMACDDHAYCNGAERCVGGACAPGLAPCAGTCDEAQDRCTGCTTDADGDGAIAASCGGPDCDDTNRAIHPGASEVCDAAGVDEDCDPTTFGDRDADGDGVVSSACCNGATCGTDCDDMRPGVSPLLLETCDALDNDCDSAIDESLMTATYLADCDGDMFAAAGADSIVRCGPPTFLPSACASAPLAGWTLMMGDCDDLHANRNPGTSEACNGIDDDCNGIADDHLGAVTFYADCDGDNYGTSAETTMGCGPSTTAPASCLGAPHAMWVAFQGDCDDASDQRHPTASERCGDGRDDDCDGRIDEGAISLYADTDGDGYGANGPAARMGCSSEPGFAIVSGDCDDARSTVHPGAPELCDGTRDDDCDMLVDENPAAAQACGNVAGTTYACTAGTCSVASCSAPRADCNHAPGDGCETDTATSAAHCGGCGMACAAGSYCSSSGCRPRYLWSHSTGSGSSDEIVDVVHDAAGNVYVAGTLEGAAGATGSVGGPSPLTANGAQETFLASYDATGTLRWARVFGGPAATDDVAPVSLGIDAMGRLYLVGQFSGSVDCGGGTLTSAGAVDLLFASFDGATGAHRWSKRFGTSTNDWAGDLGVDDAGNLVAMVQIYGTVDFGGGPRGMAATSTWTLLGLSPTGAHRFSTTLAPAAVGASNALYGPRLALDATSGETVVTAYFGGMYDFGGTTLTAAGSSSSRDLALGSYSSAGALRWVRRWGGISDDIVSAITIDATHIYLGGHFYGTTDLGGGSMTSPGSFSDMYVGSYARADGAPIWVRRFGGTDGEIVRALAVAGDGTLLVGAWFRGTVDFGGGPATGDAMVLLGLDATGGYRFGRIFTSDATPDALAVQGDHVWIVGGWNRQLDLGGGQLPVYDCMNCLTVDGFVGAFQL